MDRLNRLVVECSDAVTDLCALGAGFITDKSPYNAGQHRHPYTAIYDLLFSSKRYEDIIFGEIGIAYNASLQMWRSYFPNATLFGFEFNRELMDAAAAQLLPRTHYSNIDVGRPDSVFDALNATGRTFDVIIDDSTHLFEHQVLIIPIALEFIKPGGMIIIEDIFRPWKESRFEVALSPYFKYFSSGTFIEANHVNRSSFGEVEPYYDNDKLLVLVRNQEPAPLRNVQQGAPSTLLIEALSRPRD